MYCISFFHVSNTKEDILNNMSNVSVNTMEYVFSFLGELQYTFRGKILAYYNFCGAFLCTISKCLYACNAQPTTAQYYSKCASCNQCTLCRILYPEIHSFLFNQVKSSVLIRVHLGDIITQY